MKYVEVLVASTAYHSNDALTYASGTALEIGTVVEVPLRNSKVLGIVVSNVIKPTFQAKSILSVPDLPPLPKQTIDLIFWMQHYYPSAFGVIVQQFLPKQLPKKPVEITEQNIQPLFDLPTLTTDQQRVLAGIQSEGFHLLHGETGTGKTRIYIELAKQCLAAGKSAIILTPEIGLTSQLSQDFREAFSDRIVVLHSQLTDVTRQRLWVSILKQDKPLVIIGPRSALFAPVRNLGLVVIDESHEAAYKQDQSPYYQSSMVAGRLSALYGCPLILGSATPLVTDYYLAKAKQRPILRMHQTAKRSSHGNASISVIDLRDRSKFTRKLHLSDELVEAMSAVLGRKEQVLLFLNRRGTARVVFCEKCGWQSTCPHCDIPLVYHGDTHKMRCHSCSFQASVPTSCPECHQPSVIFKSIGTKAIVDEVQKLFPEAHIHRFDTDNKKEERIEAHYTAVKNGDIDIIIGTQTLAKGLDLPKLGLVGVIVADTSLYFPDFSAQERTYQLLSQVLGRVGRGHRAGHAVLQTYNPQSSLLQSILTKNWEEYYHTELRERKAFLFPPFCYLLKLSCRRASQSGAQKAATNLVQKLRSIGLRILVEGPAPAFHEKIQNKYQWQIIVKAKDRKELLKVIQQLPSGWNHDIDPTNLL